MKLFICLLSFFLLVFVTNYSFGEVTIEKETHNVDNYAPAEEESTLDDMLILQYAFIEEVYDPVKIISEFKLEKSTIYNHEYYYFTYIPEEIGEYRCRNDTRV